MGSEQMTFDITGVQRMERGLGTSAVVISEIVCQVGSIGSWRNDRGWSARAAQASQALEAARRNLNHVTHTLGLLEMQMRARILLMQTEEVATRNAQGKRDGIFDKIDDAFRTGLEVAGTVLDIGGDGLSALQQVIEVQLRLLLEQLLPPPPKNGATKLTLDITTAADLSARGLPLILENAKGATLTRNHDETYTLTLRTSGRAGVGQSDVNLNGSSGEVVTFRYNPRTPGDMMQLGATLATLGIGGPLSPRLLAVVPPMLLSIDNLQSVRGDVMSAELNLSRIPGLGKDSIQTGAGYQKNDKGEWERSVFVGIVSEAALKVKPFRLEGRVEGTANLEDIYNHNTHKKSSRVTLSIKGSEGAALDWKILHKYLPGQIASGALAAKDYKTLTIEYTLSEPATTVMRTLYKNDGYLNADILRNASALKVKKTEGQQVSQGSDVTSGGMPKVKGFSIDTDGARETEVTLVDWKGGK